MATTSLWRIKGRIGNVIGYIENPKKTAKGSIDPSGKEAAIVDVLDYVTRDSATDPTRLVTAINCNLKTAGETMLKTKKDYGKPRGTVAYHGYQSFAEEEVTPEQAHMIGCRLAEELWGDRFEVIVATHIDKQSHIHNHFLINTVSFVDGKKFHRTKEDYRKMQETSDRLCRENGLSVVRHPEDGKGKNYGEWLAEKKEEPTWRSMIRKDIDLAIVASLTEREFFREMEQKGYEFKLYSSKGEPLMRPSLRPKGSERYFRFDRLGEDYALDEIKDRILENIRRGIPFPEAEQEKLRRYREKYPPHPKARGLAALYYYYCYQLHIIVKFPASAKRVSSYMREDIRKLDQLDEQTRLLGEKHIETLDDLNSFRDVVKSDIGMLLDTRKGLRTELKAAVGSGSASEADGLRLKIAEINMKLKKLRHSMKVADRIEERAEHLEEMKQQLNGSLDTMEHENNVMNERENLKTKDERGGD